MQKITMKTVGLFVFILIFTFTMAACDMVSNNAVGDTASDIANDSETGELEIILDDIDLEESEELENNNDLDESDKFKDETTKAGGKSVLYNRFTDFELEFYIEYQPDSSFNYTETISIEDKDIMEDNFGNNLSVTFTALRESNWNVKVTLSGYNINTNQRVNIAIGETEAMVIAGMKREVRLEVQQVTGDLDITVDQFPSEATGGTLMEHVNVKLYDLEGELLGEMDFDHGIEGQNLLVENLFPAYYTMVVSWEGHGTVEEEVQVRVIPGKVTPVPITLFGSQLTVGVDWKAEPASPDNVMVEQTDDGFLISWDSVENADRYNVLRKRNPYYHDDFVKVGEVEHADGRLEFEYLVLKPELFEIASYNFQVVSVREHDGKPYDLTSEAAGPDDPVAPDPKEYTVTLEQNPDIGVTLSGAGDYKAGDIVPLDASDWNQGYEFINWTSDYVTIDNSYNPTDASFEMPEGDITITANFDD